MHVCVGKPGTERSDHGRDVTGSESRLVGPTTSLAEIEPLTVPEFAAGHAGFPPPPQKNTETPPLTPGWPMWMWAAAGGPVRSA